MVETIRIIDGTSPNYFSCIHWWIVVHGYGENYGWKLRNYKRDDVLLLQIKLRGNMFVVSIPRECNI